MWLIMPRTGRFSCHADDIQAEHVRCTFPEGERVVEAANSPEIG